MADPKRNDSTADRLASSRRRDETPEQRSQRKAAERARREAQAQATAQAEQAEQAESAAQAANDDEAEPKTGETLTPAEQAARAERRAKRKAREEKDRKRREKDLALLQQAEEKSREPGAISNGWTLVKMALGFGAGGWAIATVLFAILLNMQGGGLTAMRAIFALVGAGVGIYIGLYKKDLFKRIMDDE